MNVQAQINFSRATVALSLLAAILAAWALPPYVAAIILILEFP